MVFFNNTETLSIYNYHYFCLENGWMTDKVMPMFEDIEVMDVTSSKLIMKKKKRKCAIM